MVTGLLSLTLMFPLLRSSLKTISITIVVLLSSVMAVGQTVTYHLHDDSGGIYLGTGAPDVAALPLYSQDLNGATVGEYPVHQFLTPIGVPGIGGVLPNGSSVTFYLWMRKTSSRGTMYPRAKLFLNSSSGTQVCTATGTIALTTTITRYGISCSLGTNISVSTSDRLWLWVGVNLTARATQSVIAELDVEGTLNGNYDSQIITPTVLPPPHITIVDPSSAHIGETVAIIGTGLDSSTWGSVTFNGTVASPTTWTDTGISVAVPNGATSGNVIVTIAGQQSNAVPFSVTPYPPTTSLTYHLHQSAGYFTGDKHLDTAAPTTTSVFFDSGNLNNKTGSGWNFATWDGGTGWNLSGGVPGKIPPGTAFNFSVWMKKTAAVGTIHPTASLGYITYVGYYTSINLCNATATASLTTTLTKYTFSCATSQLSTLSSVNPFVVSVGFTWDGGTFPKQNCDVLFYYDGMTDYDSTVSVPEVLYPPSISGIFPSSGSVGTTVAIWGTFLNGDPIYTATPVVTFNGVVATPTTITDGSIVTPVPAGTTTGPVVVTAGGNSSNAVLFTISPTITSLSPTSGPTGTSVTITGSGFGTNPTGGTVQFNGIMASPISWTDGSIVVPVPTGASTGPVTVNVANATSNGIVFAVPPSISGLSPASGSSGTVVTINGAGFGGLQSTGMVNFNGTQAVPTSWSNAKIVTPVPSGASSGLVVVTANGLSSNGVQFSIGFGTISGVVSRASDGSAISGALAEAIQMNSVLASATTASDGSYSIPNLAAGSYDVRGSKAGFGTTILGGNAVSVNNTTTVNATLSDPGTLSGRVSQADGITGISGAIVTATQGGTSAGTATTDSSGNYSMPNLAAGSYTAQASATGYNNQTQNSVSITAGNTTTMNFSLAGQHVITYTHDELGRLEGVVDSLGDTSNYHYDAVGNILSISRNPSTQISIIDFTPKSGPVGTAVTINGTGFSADPSQDSVYFNSTSATISSASATQLVVAIPSGATTGTIRVTAPAGTVTSGSSFTVTTGGGAPTISGFTPPNGTPGAAVTITGTNFDTDASNDWLQFNLTPALGSSATSTTIVATVPSSVASGHITLSTASGAAHSSQDFFVPFGSHVPTDIGFTGRMSTNSSQSLSIGTAAKIGLMLFDGTAGQKLSILTTNSSFAACTVLLIDPLGNQLATSGCTGSSNFLDAQLLRYNGTYTVGIDPSSTTGGLTLALNSFADVAASLIAGVPTNANIAKPGQNAIYSFSGIAGRQATVAVSNWTAAGCPTGTVQVSRPDGVQLASTNLCNGAASIGATVLPMTGTYQIVFDPAGANTGTATINLTMQ